MCMDAQVPQQTGCRERPPGATRDVLAACPDKGGVGTRRTLHMYRGYGIVWLGLVFTRCHRYTAALMLDVGEQGGHLRVVGGQWI